MIDLEFIDLGRMGYREAYARQAAARDEVAARIAEGRRPVVCPVFFVEHEPAVITVSARPGAREHLRASEQMLATLGIEVCETDRGGDITYHGPGQLVAYPILDLRGLGLGVNAYMRWLEEVVIRAMARWGVAGERDRCATGVWVKDGMRSAKICALGVRISRGVTMHGLALNVTTNLMHFGTIVPCGLTGREVTSMEKVMGGGQPAMEEVKRALAEEMRQGVEKVKDYVDPAAWKREDNCREREGAG